MTDDHVKAEDVMDDSGDPALAALGAFVHVWDQEGQPVSEVVWRLSSLIDSVRPLLDGGDCAAHRAPRMRLVAQQPVVDRLRSIASAMPCEHPVEGLMPGSPIAGAMNEAADLLERLLWERDALLKAADV